VHLRRSVEDAEGSNVAGHPAQRPIIRNAVATAHLLATVDDALHRFGNEYFGHASFGTGWLAAIELPGGMPHHQARSV
jgi:hypothetical protein